ncbi:MAG: SIMPL domain-containing protein [Candidatus Pacebacteria bacterium]|nr:SIMPL domain-containing protein [Candidatus Paceibacterota bacterium]NUQ57053.1 SIMPL domain-containing protein [Candidatus Paceibacter sp.]
MDKKIKNYLGISAIVAMVIAAVSTLVFANIYSKSIQPSSYRSFSVSAEDKATAVPDVAQFSFSVISQGGKDIATLQKENSEKTNRAIGVAKASGVEDKDIKTAVYNVEPRYQFFTCPNGRNNKTAEPCPPPEIVGYTVTQSVSVKVRNFEKTSEILSGIIQSGVNSVSQLSFTIDDPAVLENQARGGAIAKAIAKAESMAEAGNFKLGRLLSISEGGFIPRFGFEKAAFGMGGDTDSNPPQIEPGSQEITVNVVLTYEIR